MSRQMRVLKTRGFTLIEVIMAASIMSVGLGTIVGALAYAGRSDRAAAQQTMANMLVTDAMEQWRDTRQPQANTSEDLIVGKDGQVAPTTDASRANHRLIWNFSNSSPRLLTISISKMRSGIVTSELQTASVIVNSEF